MHAQQVSDFSARLTARVAVWAHSPLARRAGAHALAAAALAAMALAPAVAGAQAWWATPSPGASANAAGAAPGIAPNIAPTPGSAPLNLFNQTGQPANTTPASQLITPALSGTPEGRSPALPSVSYGEQGAASGVGNTNLVFGALVPGAGFVPMQAAAQGVRAGSGTEASQSVRPADAAAPVQGSVAMALQSQKSSSGGDSGRAASPASAASASQNTGLTDRVFGATGRAAPVPSKTPSSFEELLKVKPSDVPQITPASIRIKPVREAALKESALTLGTQWGIRDRSREINREIEAVRHDLDLRYQFGALMMGTGFLPPVISEARDARAVESNVIRTAARAYRIDEPPRAVLVVPSWRDWLYMGLDPDLVPVMPQAQSAYPRDEEETLYWQTLLRTAYDFGRDTAFESFKINLARLDRSYDGMRRFYDLYKRGMVTAPVISAAATLTDTSDPSVMLVGNTVIRVVDPSKFVTRTEQWVPLGN